MKNSIVRAVAVTILLLLGGCRGPTGRDAWESVLSACTASDDLPKERMLYFGPSNPIGPGSVWAPKERGFGLRFTLDQAIPAQNVRANIVTNGVPASCNGTSEMKWSLKPSATFSTLGKPLDSTLSTEFDKAEKVTVSVKSWRVDRIQEFNYETWARSSAANGYGTDLLGTNWQSRYFMDAAIAVNGFSADLTFSAKVAADLKAKYATPVLNTGADFTGTWIGDRTLKITSTGEFYVAGSLSPVKAPGTLGMFSGPKASGRITASPIVIPEEALAKLDTFKQ